MIKKIFNFFISLPSKAMQKKKLSLVILVLLIIAFFVGRKIYISTRPLEYETYEVTKMKLEKVIEVSGEIDAEEKVDLHFQAGGKLAWINVKQGDEVKKWQAVAGLDKRTLEKQLKQDLIAFEKEYRDHEQSIEDNPNVNNRLKRILEKAQFDLDSEVLDVEIKNLAMELATLISPIAGIVTNIDTPVAGVNVLATDDITIVNPDTVYFEVEIDESDISYVEASQSATIILDAYEDEDIESYVDRIDFESSISDGGGTVFMARLTLPINENLKFRLGMTGDAEIILEKKENILAIPIDSLIERNGNTFVEILGSNGRAEKKEVEIGLETYDYVEITSGIQEFEKVIIPQ